MLQNHVVTQLPKLDEVFLQQVSSPPHRGEEVTNYFKGIFPGSCITNGGPIPWPARSSDNAKGHVKKVVHQRKVNKMLELEQQTADIVAAVENLQQQTPDIFAAVDKIYISRPLVLFLL
jgi:hypothetical protein